LSLCHIYNKTTSSAHRDVLLSSFAKTVSVDISQVSVLEDFAIYIVEIEEVTKSVSLKIKEIFELKISPLIYFIIPKKHSLMLFQLAFLVEAKTIITINQDSEKIVKKLKSDLLKHTSQTSIERPIQSVDEPTVSSETQNYRIASRINFVELLKDKLLQKMISSKSYSVLTISINDLKIIAQGMEESDREYFRKEFVFEVELILEDKIMLAQYDADMYVVIFEDISFESLKKKAHSFHIQMSRFINKQKFSPSISLYALDLQSSELNSFLKIFDNISHKKLTKLQKRDKNLEYINNIQESMSEEEIISFLLDSAFVNSADFKLLNVYKGIFINTKSAILKKDNNAIYVKVEQIQGSVMGLQKKTVIQSSAFIRDIQATVRYVNVQEKIAILENFKILDLNVNLRKHGRVNPERKTAVALSLVGSKIKGEIVDISANSISLKVKQAKALNGILNKDIGLDFYLPSSLAQSGQFKLDETAAVIYAADIDKGYTKIVCIFDKNTKNEDFLMDYVYSRQRGIIRDMKNMLK